MPEMIDLLSCLRCGRCRAVCPTLESLGWESMGPRGRIMLCLGYLEGAGWIEGVSDSLYTCTTCGACSFICPSGVDVDSIVEYLRREYLKSHKDGRIEEMYEAIRIYGNPMGDTRSRWWWLEGVNGITLRRRSDIIYFAGCLLSYRSREVAVSTLRILADFGVALLEDERCCGSPLLRLGVENPPTMEDNIRQIEESGAELILTSCPGCYMTLKNDYNLDCSVMHTAEFFSEHLDEIDPGRLGITVTYHDPCHLARGEGVIEEPRAVIERICKLHEMKRSRELSGCCGGGGGVRSGYHNLSRAITVRRLEDVPPDADLIVTTCPLCIINLSDGGGNVIDLAQLIERSKM